MFGVKILEEKKSSKNGQLKVVKTLFSKPYIQAQGLTQSGGIVETIWKGALGKVKLKKVRTCLILGYGGGTVARLIGRKWPYAKITGVDNDSDIVNLGQKYLESFKKADVYIKDAEEFLKVNRDKYDLIIVDLYKGANLPAKFKTEAFYKLVAGRLSAGGIAVFNSLSLRKMSEENIGPVLEKVFGKIQIFRPIVNLVYICSN